MKSTKVYLLDGGSLEISNAVAFNDPSYEGRRRIPVFSVLIDHSEGLYLYDTGFSLAHATRNAPHTKPLQTPSQTVPSQLSILGMRPSDVTHVVNSHFHFDHCGANHLCASARVICHSRELEAISSSTPPFGYSDRTCLGCLASGASAVALGRELEKYQPRIESVTGDMEVAKGVHLIETAGHTAGHCSLLVVLSEDRKVLFTGDACYARVNFDEGRLQAGHQNIPMAQESLQRLKSLTADPGVNTCFPHDPESWRGYLKAPLFYD